MPSLPLRLVVLSLLLPAATAPARATTVERMSLGEMAAASSAVVHGTVLSTSSRWNEDRSLILTEVRIQVIESLKGNSGGVVVVTQPGGQVGKVRVDVPGASAFRPGEETVLFLGPGGDRGFSVAGLSRGRYEVVTDEKTGGKTVRGADLRGTRALDPLGTGSPTGVSGKSLEDFLGQVRRLVQETGTGK